MRSTNYLVGQACEPGFSSSKIWSQGVNPVNACWRQLQELARPNNNRFLLQSKKRRSGTERSVEEAPPAVQVLRLTILNYSVRQMGQREVTDNDPSNNGRTNQRLIRTQLPPTPNAADENETMMSDPSAKKTKATGDATEASVGSAENPL